MNRRVVVTGLGAVTPLGNDVESYWDGLKNGRNGIGPITRFDASGLKAQLAAQGGERMPLRPTAMTATLQTLPSLEGYWLDSGIIVSEG